jgi:hypothetical protein
VRDGDRYAISVFGQDNEIGTWRYNVHIVFDAAAQGFKVLETKLEKRRILEARHGLFLILDLISHLSPQTVKLEIPIEGGTPIVEERLRTPVQLHKWGNYHIPHFKDGTYFCPGLDFFETQG